MIRSLLNWLVNATLLIVLYGGQAGTIWFNNKLKDMLLLLSSIFVSAIFTFVFQHTGRRINLSITMRNRKTGKNVTEYHQGDTGQAARTIDLTVRVKRKRGSAFLLRHYLKKHQVTILIDCNPTGLELSAMGDDLKSEIIPKDDSTGFHIDVTEYLKSILVHNSNAEPERTHPFFLKEPRENRQYFNGPEKCYINPTLKVNKDKDAPWYIKCALNWNSDQHKIEYYPHSGFFTNEERGSQ